jgi:ParB family chromosome partitioning protein
MWKLHDRLEEYLTEENCREEIESFERHGQIVPALGRTLRGDTQCDVELVCGARRLFVARHLNKPLRVILRDMTDREALLAMELENRHRKDICPYERGLSYARLLRTRCFDSQEDLANALQVSASQVSRLLRLARLPSVIVGAFRSPADICEAWGLDLAAKWETPAGRDALGRAARQMASRPSRPPAAEIFEILLAAGSGGRKPRPSSHDEVVKDSNGSPLFRVRRLRKSVVLVLPHQRVAASNHQGFMQVMALVLEYAAAPSMDMGKFVDAMNTALETIVA